MNLFKKHGYIPESGPFQKGDALNVREERKQNN